jgi:mercuric ion transport protein
MLQTWHTVKGGVAAVVAFIACPCHLPLTLPLLIMLTASTAFGTWLENNTVTVGVISTVIFVGGLVLAFKWMTDSNASPAPVAQTDPPKANTHSDNAHTSPNGMPNITLITSSACASCKGAKAVWEQTCQHANFQYQEIDISSAQGRELAAKYNIFSTPATIINGKVVKPGQISLDDALAMISAASQTT